MQVKLVVPQYQQVSENGSIMDFGSRYGDAAITRIRVLFVGGIIQLATAILSHINFSSVAVVFLSADAPLNDNSKASFCWC